MSESPSGMDLMVGHLKMTPKRNGTFRSNREIAEMMNIREKQVSGSLTRLSNMGILRMEGPGNNPFYYPGEKYYILRYYEEYDCSDLPCSEDEPCVSILPDYVNGLPPTFNVIEQGSFSRIQIMRGEQLEYERKKTFKKDYDGCIDLFDEKRAGHTNGLTEYRTHFDLSIDGDEKSFSIAYRIGPNVNNVVIHPGHKIYVSSREAMDPKTLKEILYRECVTALDLLSENNWVIEKDTSGNYAMRNTIGDCNYHKASEGEASDHNVENSEEKYGSPRSTLSIDTSPEHREVECGNGSIVRDVANLPQTEDTVRNLGSATPKGKEDRPGEPIEHSGGNPSDAPWWDMMQIVVRDLNGYGPTASLDHVHIHVKGADE